MDQRVTPEFFCGSAIAALVGLLCGLLLHGPWEDHSHGSQIWFSSAAAEELARPLTDRDLASSADDQPSDDTFQTAELDIGYVPQEPLPVTRLDPDRFDIKPAAAEPEAWLDREYLEEDDAADAVPAPATPSSEGAELY